MKKLFTLFVAVFICAIHSRSQDWHITGNAGTATGTNFLGTTDNKALMFKVNNQRSGYIDFAVANASTSFGYQSLKNPSGNSNTAIGYKSMLSNTSGSANTSLGGYSLFFNTTGNSNVALGFASMYRTTTGYSNVAVGDSSLYDNTIGYFNTATGYLAMFRNINGFENTANGFNALHFNTSGAQNTAVGSSALRDNASGNFNTSLGAYALTRNSTGNSNTAVGYYALNFSEPGTENVAVGSEALSVNTSGSYNTSLGTRALDDNSTGESNVACGVNSMHGNISGDNNTAVGPGSLYGANANLNTAIGRDALSGYPSDGNTGIGYSAGALNNNGGSFNTFLGAYSSASSASSLTNSSCIGYNSRITASNQVRIGNSSVTSIGGYVNWSNISDGRYKKNIKENVPGLQFINKLEPVTYTLDATGIYNFLHKNIPGDKNKSAEEKAVMQKALKEKEQIRYTGFVAQDVEIAAKELNYDFSGIDAPKNENNLYGLRYAEFVVPLVKAVQELSAIVDNQQKQIDELKALLISQNKNVTDKNQTASNQ